MKCGLNEVCAPCGLDGCNTYDCKNRDGKGVGCAAVCLGEPTCVCQPNYARKTPKGQCEPLDCPCEPTTPPNPPSELKFNRIYIESIDYAPN